MYINHAIFDFTRKNNADAVIVGFHSECTFAQNQYSALTLIQDVITGDELASDAYPMKEEGPFLTIDCQVSQSIHVPVASQLNDIFQVITVGGEGADIGGDEGGVDDSKEQKINLVHSFGLTPTQFDKKSYTVHLKVVWEV